MRVSGRLAMLGMAVLLGFLLSAANRSTWETGQLRLQEAERMKNVVVLGQDPTGPPEAAPEPAAEAEAPEEEASGEPPEVLVSVMQTRSGADLRETTISGAQLLKNETSYALDPEAILQEGPSLRLPAEGPQILIIHTHGSEAYTPAGLDRYEASDTNRTQDPRYSVIRVGDELAERLEEQGLRVIHDREIYDYPSYTGSYSRSGEAVERCLEQYPGIAVVIDLHRDALGADGVVYKTMAEEEGTVASQVMLLVGSDESGLEHPNWRENLALALYLQQAAAAAHPTLMRPVSLFAEAAGPALLALAEQGEA